MNRMYFIILALLLLAFGVVQYFAEQYAANGNQSYGVPTKTLVIDSRAAPEASSGVLKKAAVHASKFMVAAANPHASKAGALILKQGGNAVDAVIAVQLVLNLVEPQSSGIGGGAFLLFWDAKDKNLKTYDGRETAPSGVNEKLFLRENGSALSFGEAVRSGRSIGVPGIIAMLMMVHEQHGSLAWNKLFQPAIKLSMEGFAVSKRLNKLLVYKGYKFFNETGRSYFFDENQRPRPVGYILKNPAFAETLKLLADKGAAGFYEGALAEKIIATAKASPAPPSKMTLSDLKGYFAVERAPVCGTYHGNQVCGMGPPSSGGLTVAMILGLLEPLPLGDKPSVKALHLIAEAEKLAFADRNHYMADPQFTDQPMGYLFEDYLSERRKLIDPARAMEKASPGNVPLMRKTKLGIDETFEHGGTSHLSIIDSSGNITSMTSSIEGAFGSGQMVGGFLLNNELTDFSFKPVDAEGKPIANRVAPLKRPRSSMAPTIVFSEKWEPRIVVGSPGGSRIISFVVKAITAHVNWGMGPQEAVSLYNFGSRNGPFELEKRADTIDLVPQLTALGQKVRFSSMTSGLHMIVIKRNGQLIGGADPRREGSVIGGASAH